MTVATGSIDSKYEILTDQLRATHSFKLASSANWRHCFLSSSDSWIRLFCRQRLLAMSQLVSVERARAVLLGTDLHVIRGLTLFYVGMKYLSPILAWSPLLQEAP